MPIYAWIVQSRRKYSTRDLPLVQVVPAVAPGTTVVEQVVLPEPAEREGRQWPPPRELYAALPSPGAAFCRCRLQSPTTLTLTPTPMAPLASRVTVAWGHVKSAARSRTASLKIVPTLTAVQRPAVV